MMFDGCEIAFLVCYALAVIGGLTLYDLASKTLPQQRLEQQPAACAVAESTCEASVDGAESTAAALQRGREEVTTSGEVLLEEAQVLLPQADARSEQLPSLLPGGAVRSVVEDGAKLMGGSAVMYSFDAYEDRAISASVQRGLWYDSGWEAICQLFLQEMESFNFLDVGAGIGTYTVPMALCLQRKPLLHRRVAQSPAAESAQQLPRREPGQVIAIEAAPANLPMLRANAEKNARNNTMIFPYAVSNADDAALGSLPLSVPKADRSHAGLTTALSAPWPAAAAGSAAVTTLDAIYRASPDEMKKVLFMKLHVEGYEGRALYGAETFLTEAPPCFIQMHLNKNWLELADTPVLQVLGFLGRMGYGPYYNEIDSFRGNRDGGSIEGYFAQRRLEACVASKKRWLQ
eukprot:TRINITY_DN47363_c0_g1_i1.p1 TRINITY_DN47363_c0_g1~~TRINITY_DN47363_c0_g1_i1.p1  ORF type:complete len:403 (+),score=96.30 TRINITY_DN47363_c0_g1_i1:92-1300(+)